MNLEGNTKPIEVWLTKKNIEVKCRIVFEDETDDERDVDSLSIRGAQREMTAWLIRQGYEPADRWDWSTDGDDDDFGETVRTFRKTKAGRA